VRGAAARSKSVPHGYESRPDLPVKRWYSWRLRLPQLLLALSFAIFTRRLARLRIDEMH
jgi:hypothetical protein